MSAPVGGLAGTITIDAQVADLAEPLPDGFVQVGLNVDVHLSDASALVDPLVDPLDLSLRPAQGASRPSPAHAGAAARIGTTP